MSESSDPTTELPQAPNPTPAPTEPYMVLRCGGMGGKCCKPIFVPLTRFDDIDELRAMLQDVGWAILDQQAGVLSVLDVACPSCLLVYITGQLQAQGQMSSPQTKAALASLAGQAREPSVAPESPES